MKMPTKWFKNHGKRTMDETGSALGFIIWKISFDRLKSIRKADFGVFGPKESMGFLTEVSLFLIHNADRVIYEKYSPDERAALLQKIAMYVAANYVDNAQDAFGPGDHKNHFIDQLNQRLTEYSQIGGSGEALRFSLTRLLGTHVELLVPEKDRPWVAQQLIESEMPDIFTRFDKACESLLVQNQQ